MRVLILLLLGVGLVAPVPVRAELSPDQFAYGLPLEVSGEQAFYELELPLAVYQGSLRDDLGDIRVFNGAGKVVPHLLRHPANQTRQQEVVTSELPFFPLPGRADRPADALSLHIERNPEGMIVDVKADPPTAEAELNVTCGYLLDTGGVKQRLDVLELLWAADTPAFLAEVQVATSDDLVSWRPLTTAAVARLSYQDFRLDQNKIILPRANGRYLRLNWNNGQAAAVLHTVRVLSRQSTLVELPAQRQLMRTADAVSERRFRVDLQAALPVTSVTINLPEQNSLAALRLLSSNTAKGPLRERWHGLAYNLVTNGSRLANPAIKLPPSRQRYWELILDAGETTFAAAPRLQFSWQPDRLVFLAQGAGPYFVAYGCNRVAAPDFHIDQLLKSSAAVAQPQRVQPGTVFELGGEAVRSVRAPLPWKKYTLWGVLLLGVLLIGGLSFSLYRKLQDSEPHP
jgi:Protein of unknown function (DUF3999)